MLMVFKYLLYLEASPFFDLKPCLKPFESGHDNLQKARYVCFAIFLLFVALDALVSLDGHG